MKTRSNDRLANLPPEDRAKLDAWLPRHSLRQVVKFAAAPRPDGLAVATNIRALSRYHHKFLTPNPSDQLAELALIHPAAAEQAAALLIQTKALEAAARPNLTGSQFNALSRYHFRLKQDALRHRELDLQQLKLMQTSAPPTPTTP
jgi:hypothetical protein